VIDRRSWGWFAAWAAVGIGIVAGMLAAFVPPLTLALWLASGVGAIIIAKHKEARVAWPGVVAGAAILALLVAYTNIGGPGEVCTSHIGHSCTSLEERGDPWPFAAAGLVMLGGSLLWFTFNYRRKHRPLG
jgi:hypothetical protein